MKEKIFKPLDTLFNPVYLAVDIAMIVMLVLMALAFMHLIYSHRKRPFKKFHVHIRFLYICGTIMLGYGFFKLVSLLESNGGFSLVLTSALIPRFQYLLIKVFNWKRHFYRMMGRFVSYTQFGKKSISL